jgi:O-antigen/teichoic acid export membrane protein
LNPTDYGLIGITVIFLSIAEVLITNGFGQAFIQKKDSNDLDARTILITNFLLSVFIYLIIYLASPFISFFFKSPELISIIRVFSIVIILNSVSIIQVAIIRKNLDFKRKARITLISMFIASVISIGLAYLGYGVWSLVFQQIINKLIFNFLLFRTSNLKFKIEFSYDSLRSMLVFRSWLLLNGIFTKLFENIYRIMIGRFNSAEQLGYFDRGQQFAGMIYQQVTWSVGSVAFPVYSKLLDNQFELKKALVRFVKYSTLITMPILLILFIISEPFVVLLLTEKWIGSIVYLKLFCLIGILMPFYELLTQFIEAIGRAKNVFWFTFIYNMLRVINIFITFKHGIYFLLIGEIAIILLSILWVSVYSKKLIGFNFINIFWLLRNIFIVNAIIFFFGKLLFNAFIFDMILQLLLVPFLMMVFYVILLFLFERSVFKSLQSSGIEKGGL